MYQQLLESYHIQVEILHRYTHLTYSNQERIFSLLNDSFYSLGRETLSNLAAFRYSLFLMVLHRRQL